MSIVQRASHPLPEWIMEVARTWTWRHSLLGVGLGALNIAFGQNGGMLLLPDFIEKQYFSALLYNVFQFGLPLVLAVRVADRAVDGGARALPAYGTAVVLVAAGGSWLAWLFNLTFGGDVWCHAANAKLALAVGVLYALGVTAYLHNRRAQKVLARVGALETERANQMQLLQASRLLALQARVEPQLLFTTLRRVSDLVPHDILAADALLSDMIALLRAVVPTLGKTSTTIHDDCALAEAYARVQGRASRQALPVPQWQLTAIPEAAEARISPTLVLPLLRAISTATDSPQTRWNVNASLDGGQLQIRITHAAGDEQAARRGLQAIDLATIRARLAGVHGEHASLRIIEAPALTILLNLPVIHDDRADR